MSAGEVTSDLADLVDLDRYPIHDPDSGHYCETPATAYLGFPDPDFPLDHPRQWIGRSAVNAVAHDLFPPPSPPASALRERDRPAIHRGHPRTRHPPSLRRPARGPQPGVDGRWRRSAVALRPDRLRRVGGDARRRRRRRLRRGAADRSVEDERYDDVRKVLGGERSQVVTLPMVPGTLLIFEGRNSLHRVSPIEGTTTRLVGLLSYDTAAGTRSSDLLKQVRYGRTAEIGA